LLALAQKGQPEAVEHGDAQAWTGGEPERDAECEPISNEVFARPLSIKEPEHAETKIARWIAVDLYTRWGKP